MKVIYLLCQHTPIEGNDLDLDDHETTDTITPYETLGGALANCPDAPVGYIPAPNTNRPFTGGIVWRSADWSIRWARIQL
jgi:hypothetical protein